MDANHQWVTELMDSADVTSLTVALVVELVRTPAKLWLGVRYVMWPLIALAELTSISILYAFDEREAEFQLDFIFAITCKCYCAWAVQ